MTARKAQQRRSTRSSEFGEPSATPPATAESQLEVEELEERITPRLASNHNETLLVDA